MISFCFFRKCSYLDQGVVLFSQSPLVTVNFRKKISCENSFVIQKTLILQQSCLLKTSRSDKNKKRFQIPSVLLPCLLSEPWRGFRGPGAKSKDTALYELKISATTLIFYKLEMHFRKFFPFVSCNIFKHFTFFGTILQRLINSILKMEFITLKI